MSKRAKEGAIGTELARMAVPICQEAERRCPRNGPGRKPTIPDWVLAVMIVMAVLHRRKSKSAQFASWKEHPEWAARWLPGQALPGRSTFFERYRRAWIIVQEAIRLQGEMAIANGWADPETVAFDKSLIASQGNPRHQFKGRKRKAGRNVDLDAGWGCSTHDGWVYGYGYEVAVTAPRRGVNWPLLGSVGSGNCSEQKTILEKIPQLPAGTRHVLADSGYDSNHVGETVEGSAKRRHFLCPEVPRPNVGRKRRSRPECRIRQEHRKKRAQRKKYFESPTGQRLYRRRKTTVEPFNERFKRLFELHDRVWHKGLGNNRTQLLAAIFAYQLLLAYNHHRGQNHARVGHLVNRL